MTPNLESGPQNHPSEKVAVSNVSGIMESIFGVTGYTEASAFIVLTSFVEKDKYSEKMISMKSIYLWQGYSDPLLNVFHLASTQCTDRAGHVS